MNVFDLCGIAVCCCCFAAIVKSAKSDLSPYVTLAGGLILTAAAVFLARPVVEYARKLADESGFGSYFEVLFKALGIAVLCQFSAEVCRDCGESSVASRVELAGKVSILALSLPVIKKLLEIAKGMI